MPVSPKQAKEHVTQEEQKALDEAIAFIDQKLPLEYMGGKIDIKLPESISLSKRMRPKLIAAYVNVGWKQVYFAVNTENTFTLDERSPSAGGYLD